MFTVQKISPAVSHIQDVMGVCMTLIEGEREAILIDAGYGLEDVAGFVRTLTDRPVRLILTHGHHDHILGARWFPRSWLHPADQEEFLIRTGRPQRERVADQASQKEIAVPEDFMTACIPAPDPLEMKDFLGDFPCAKLDLGRKEAWILHVPGHTPGSLVCFLPEEQLLLTGDDWNPCTWLWFPSSVAIREWKTRMTDLLRTLEETTGKPPARVLCSHQPGVREGAELVAYLEEITGEAIQNAPPTDMGSPIETCRIQFSRPEWTLVFDRKKGS